MILFMERVPTLFCAAATTFRTRKCLWHVCNACVLLFSFFVYRDRYTPTPTLNLLHHLNPIYSIVCLFIHCRVGHATSKMPRRFLPSLLGSDPSFQDMQMSSPHIRDPMYCYTVAVGKKPSRASSWVNDAQAVAELLVNLSMGEQDTSILQSWRPTSPSSLFE